MMGKPRAMVNRARRGRVANPLQVDNLPHIP
jgi:hypothetical protein